ncbi:MAG: flavin reductase family protein [Thermomicrobiales bacterium]
MDDAAKKQMLRLFTYGLYAVTARDGDDAAAMTVNWATQVSFAPPVIAVSMERESRTRAIAMRTGRFALCVFAADQREPAALLGRHSAKVPDKFAGVAWTPGDATGCPLIDGTLGALECRITATMEAGDSLLVVAEVIAAHTLREGEPLTMQAAGFRHAG